MGAGGTGISLVFISGAAGPHPNLPPAGEGAIPGRAVSALDAIALYAPQRPLRSQASAVRNSASTARWFWCMALEAWPMRLTT